MMNKALLGIFIIFISFCSVFSSPIDYVNSGKDFFIVIRNLSTAFEKFRETSEFFDYLMNDEGLNVENILASFGEILEQDKGVNMDLLEQVFDREIILTGEGLGIKIADFISLDPNYFVDLLKNMGKGFYVVFDVDTTDEASELLCNFARLFDAEIKQYATSFELRMKDAMLYAWYDDDVFVLAGSESGVFDATDARSDEKNRMVVADPVASSVYVEHRGDFVCGYFLKDSLKLDMSLELSVSTKYVTLGATVCDEGLVVDLHQLVEYDSTQAEELVKSALVKTEDFEDFEVVGNYFVGISSSLGEFALNEFKKWLKTQDEESYQDIYSFLNDLVSSVESIGLSGDLTEASPTFTFIAKSRDGSFETLWNKLRRWRVEKERKDHEYVGKLRGDGTYMYFIESRGKFIITSWEPGEFAGRFYKAPSLGVLPSYTILRKGLLDRCLMLLFLDTSSVISEYFDNVPVGGFVVQQSAEEDGILRTKLVFK